MPTMRDVAKRAGVSYTTVSFVLNNRNSPRGIGEATRSRVLEAAAALSYRPNEFARAVVTGKSHVLGFINKGLDRGAEFRMSVQSGFLEETSSRGFVVKHLFLSDPKNAPDIVDQCLSWRISGALALGVDERAVAVMQRALFEHQIPVATIEQLLTSSSTGLNVRADEAGGFRLLVQHLVGLGHRRFGYLSASHEIDANARQRTEIAWQTLRDAGVSLDDYTMAEGDWWDIDANEKAATYIFTRPKEYRPTALLCCGDPGALVAIKVARSLGLRVPTDVSIVGFGDYTMASYSDPGLTTIAQPFAQEGRAAAHWLIEHMKKAKSHSMASSPEEEMLPTRLVVRSSTAPPPH